MKKLLLAMMVLLGTVSPSLGQGVRYPNQVFNPGVGFPNATIRVCVEPATGTPCTPLASIFSDAALSNPLANPFSSDANGNFAFFANPSSTYHVQISGDGISTYDIPDITLPGGGTVVGGGTTVLINASPVAAPSANFNSSQPAIPANNLAVTFQKDSNGIVTGVSAYVPYSSPTQLGVVQLAEDLGNIATNPRVVATHLTSPLPITQGGCNSTTRAGCFNNISPSTQTGGLIVGSGPDSYGNLPAPSVGITCLTDTTGTVAWIACGNGTVTGAGTANLLTKFISPTVVGNSGIQDTGTLISTAENVQLTGGFGIGSTSVPGGSSSLPANGTTISSLADIESVITGTGGSTPVRNNLVLSQDLNYSTNWQTSDAPLKIWQQTDALNAASLTGGGFMRGAQITTTHVGSGSVSIRGLSSSAFATGAGAVPENDAVVAIAQENGASPITANNAILAQSGLLGGNGNIATDATINIASPAVSSSGTMATHYGLFIADQTVGASKNPLPYAIYVAGGNEYLGGALGVGVGSVPGNCSSLAVSANYCDTASFTNIDAEQTSVTNPLARNFNVFNLMNINLSSNSILNYFDQKLTFQTDPASTHGTGGTLGGMLIVGANRGLAGSGSSFFDGLDIDIGQNSTTAGMGDMRGINIKVLSGCTGSNCASVANQYGIQIQTGGAALSSPVGVDYGIRILSPGANVSQGLISHHYGLYFDDQTTGSSQNPDPFAIFEANPNEKNQLGAIAFQGAMVAATTSTVNMASASHTLPVFVGTITQITAKSGTTGELAFATDATAGQNLYYCPATATPCSWVQQLNSGGAGAMSTSASNAALTAVPVDWRPSGTGNVNLGDAAHPWGGARIGNAATNNIFLTGTATAARTATLPDNTGTIAELNLSQTWTATQTFAGVIASSISSTTANPAASGFGRLANPDVVNIRNGTNAGDITALSADANNFVYLGQSGASGVRFPTNIGSLTSGLALTIQPTANTGNGAGGVTTIAGGAGSGTGANGDVVVTTSTAGTGLTAVIQLLAAITFPLTNNSPTGTVINQLASYDSSGRAIVTPPGSTLGLAGVCAEGCGTAGTGLFARLGKFNVNLDNTGIPGHYVGISPTTAGFGTDCGTSPCGTQLVGTVTAAVSGTVYTVDLAVGGGSSGNTAANVIISNPIVSQTIQALGPTIVSLAVQCPASAASTLDCFEVKDNTGANVFRARQDGSVIWGNGGTAGTITAQALISPTAPAATIGEVRCGDTDTCVAWRNHANNADITLSKDTQDVVHLNAVFDATVLTLTGNSITMTEAAAASAVAAKDIVYADSTFHLPFFKNNNGAAYAIDYISQVNTQAGTTYTIVASDISKIVNLTSGSAIAVTVPQATGQFANHACFTVNAFGAGTATLTPTTSTINGGASLALASGKSAKVCADGTGNYLALVSITSAGAGDMIKNAVNTMGASGTLDASGSSVLLGLRLPNGAGANPTVLGNMAADSTTNLPVFGNGTGTITLGAAIPNVQSGTTYTVLTGDRTKLVSIGNAGAVAVTLPQAGSTFPNGWYAWFENTGVGAVTITPTTSTIDGVASITLTTNQGVMIASNGTNYFTANRGLSSGLNDCSTNGFLARTGANTTSCVTLTGTSNQIIITHGVGDGTPVFSLDTTHVALDTNALTFTNKNISGATNTFSAIPGATLNNNSVTSTQTAVVNTRRQCDLPVGDSSGPVITNGQLGPQKHICKIPYAATVVEVDVDADGGTPNVIVGRRRCTTFAAGACTVETGANLLSSALATNASGLGACSNTGGTTGIDGGTTCAATLQNTGLNAGDWIELVSGTAGGTAKFFVAHVFYVVQ